jgi:hypothetical protein
MPPYEDSSIQAHICMAQQCMTIDTDRYLPLRSLSHGYHEQTYMAIVTETLEVTVT